MVRAQDLRFRGRIAALLYIPPTLPFTAKKYPYIHGYFPTSFPSFNGAGSVYVGIRKSTE